MLIKYKNAYHKIAMGLLSFMPNVKDIKLLQEIIDRYENDDDWELFLFKENDDIIGVIGIHHLENGDAELCHVCVNPSYRAEGIGKQMVKLVVKKVKGEIFPTEETKSFFLSCQEDEDEHKEET